MVKKSSSLLGDMTSIFFLWLTSMEFNLAIIVEILLDSI